MNIEFITDKNGNKTKVVLALKDFGQLTQKLEDLEDVLDAYEAKLEGGPLTSLEDLKGELSTKEDYRVAC